MRMTSTACAMHTIQLGGEIRILEQTGKKSQNPQARQADLEADVRSILEPLIGDAKILMKAALIVRRSMQRPRIFMGRVHVCTGHAHRSTGSQHQDGGGDNCRLPRVRIYRFMAKCKDVK